MSLSDGQTQPQTDRRSALSEQQQARLSQLLSKQPIKKEATISARTAQGPVPATFVQQRLWFIEQMNPGNTAYNLYNVLRIRGPVNADLLERSIARIIARHESLRTTFQIDEKGNPLQHLAPTLDWLLERKDLSLDEEREQSLQTILEQATRYRFDLQRGPLLYGCVVRLDAHEHVLVLVIHHIVFDGWSFRVFIHELKSFYEAEQAGGSPTLPALAIQYADYALWQQEWLKSEQVATHLAYWQEHLSGTSFILDLPTDRPRPQIQTLRGTSLTFALPSELTAQVKAFCIQQGCTLFQALLAAFQIVLSRYSGQTDFLIGTPMANRTPRETEPLIGLFVNTLVFRAQLTGEPGFQAIVAKVREETLDASSHQELPFEKLVETLQSERDLSRNPLFQVMFAFQNNQQVSYTIADLQIHSIRLPNPAAQFELNLSMADTSEGIKGAIEYNTDLFDEATIQRLSGHFQSVLQAGIEHPTASFKTLPLLTASEKQQLATWNATHRAFPLEKAFHELFTEQVWRSPRQIAFRYQQRSMTYEELNQRANQLAHALLAQNIPAEAPIGLFMERSLPMVVAILAIWKAGAAYIPLDPVYPRERITQILENAHPVLLLTQMPIASAFQEIPQIAIADDWQGLDEWSSEEPPGRTLPDSLAYTIYTSGSTGIPKGAMVTHRGMLNHLFAKVSDLQISAEDHLAQTASHCFDISVWQFFSALLVGGTVTIFPDEVTHNPERLLTETVHSQITILEIVPSLLRAILDTGAQTSIIQHLRYLVVTGEALPTELCQRWFRDGSTIPLVNAYGPTECSDDVTHGFIEPATTIAGPSAPIGRTIANTQLYLVDERFLPVPIGVTGELYVGGTGVGRGYLSDPERTATAFLPDPFSGEAGARLYKTGDLARYLHDGTIEFLGRIDHQIKLRGYRIELGEIEAVLNSLEGVQSSVIVLHTETAGVQAGQQRLIAYVVNHAESGPTASQLRQALKERLPEYMVPAAFIFLAALPLTTNGKIDRKALPAPQENELARIVEYRPPQSALEQAVARAWQEILHIEHVGVQDNFFDLGGHSLLLIQVQQKLKDVFTTRKVTLLELFQYPTISALVDALAPAQGVAQNHRASSQGQNRAQSRRAALKRLRQEER
ncbi:non-ribosomal peptide synthetase [Tengunoibacter tsumagoiensis]|uniref:Carrier domain-containing protein n=1 Tax=Tengunoibacter tsumagoiensis TaxID=2014871 RepID=A0A402A6G1_9CHLR|nr:non-ribosomal peptide synthetase [Tengunoibacter tsumagoiensis]GCE14616.1 hypothetical protein KTT_44750 [Tengunoibacter tsumagoiensis]